MKKTIKNLIILIVVWAAFSLGSLNNSSHPKSAKAQTTETYTPFTNTAPLPSTFVAYPSGPWHMRIPENPEHTWSSITPALQGYFSNDFGSDVFTEANNYLKGCNGSTGDGTCGGFADNPIWQATTNDVPITITCDSHVVYGCTDHDVLVPSFSYSAYIPAHATTGCTYEADCFDKGMSVVQPDGTVFEFYGCPDNIDGAVTWTAGEVIDYHVCPSGMTHANFLTDHGVSASTSSGPNPEISPIYYNQFINNSIDHAIYLEPSCVTNSYVYPAQGQTAVCASGGVPGGTHAMLNLTHAQIDTLIASGTFIAGWKALYYAMADYGGYLIDTNASCGHPALCGDWVWAFESARPWITNGQNNPWVSVFTGLGGSLASIEGGNPIWLIQTSQLFQGMAPYIVALDPCYAEGTCSDSITGSPPTVTLTASPTTITSGSPSTLTWSSTNATSCTASGAWSGSENTSGTQSVSPTSTSIYTLTCTGTGGSANASATVTVTTSTPSPDGTRIPVKASSIIDTSGNTWTLSSGIMYENGVDSTGRGSQLLFYHNNIYGLGTDFNWWQWTGSTWISVGPNDPSGALKGDLNYDHIVNSIDWSIMNSQWFTNNSQSDLNHDGIVNSIDFSILNANWFKTW